MSREIEIKLFHNHELMRNILIEKNAKCNFQESLFRRKMFDNDFLKAKRAWIRLRDEVKQVTLTYKQVVEDSIDGVIEHEITVDSFKKTEMFLNSLGFIGRNYQETKREEWELNGCKISLDTWPQLNEIIEIEGMSKDAVVNTLKLLGLNLEEGFYKNVDELYKDIDVDIYQIDELKF